MCKMKVENVCQFSVKSFWETHAQIHEESERNVKFNLVEGEKNTQYQENAHQTKSFEHLSYNHTRHGDHERLRVKY